MDLSHAAMSLVPMKKMKIAMVLQYMAANDALTRMQTSVKQYRLPKPRAHGAGPGCRAGLEWLRMAGAGLSWASNAQMELD
jgi:hypothetical protein